MDSPLNRLEDRSRVGYSRKAFLYQAGLEPAPTYLSRQAQGCLERNLPPTSVHIPLKDIVSATKSFAHENLIRQGEVSSIYKGKLKWSGQSINIVARRFDCTKGDAHVQFRTEISMLSRLKHANVVSFVGSCDVGGEKIILNKYEVNGSLDKYLSGRTLTWMQRLRICVGAARGLSYIYHDNGHNYSVIHRNIKNSKFVLDENLEARVCGFGLSVANLSPRRQRLVLLPPCGTLGYIDPVYSDTGSVSHKSDVYSFGVVLFEVLCGRKALGGDSDGFQSLALLARDHYDNENLDEIIDPHLRKQMDLQSFTIFSETAYHCLNGQRTQRPDMEDVVRRLEKALELQRKYENPTLMNFEHLRITLEDIVFATDNFADTYCIGSGGYGAVYKAELVHFDSKSSSAVQGKTKDELPKKCSRVAIKRIFSRQDGQGEQGFYAEIEMLSRCKHRNIVSLLGFCEEKSERILVYELASNGSLEGYLGKTDKMTTFTWKQRIKLCLDIANGLNYLHTTMKDKERIIHRDIKSANILLYKNWEAKIADFGLSRFHPASTVNTKNIAGTEVYLDPEYLKTGKLKKESDTYSFGVVLFEIICGRLAYDEIYDVDNEEGLPATVRRHFNEGTLEKLVDPKIKAEIGNLFTLNRGPDQDSLDTFIKIAYQCLAETQAARPTMEVVIKELEKALYLQLIKCLNQENSNDKLKFSLEDIKLITQNFSDDCYVGRAANGKVYRGEVSDDNGHKMNIALNRSSLERHDFLTELEILFEYKHENVVGLVGYCNEMNEKIIVYEYASRGSLDRYLEDNSLTWMNRLQICIDLATGLEFLHSTSGVVNQEVVIHRNINSSNILLNGDWRAKFSDFGLSLICPIDQADFDIDLDLGTVGGNFLYSKTRTRVFDIWSLGVVLFEILGWRLAVDKYYNVVEDLVNESRVKEKVFEGIKKQIVPQSLSAYFTIAYQCIDDDMEKRPSASEVVLQLKKALEFQVEQRLEEPQPTINNADFNVPAHERFKERRHQVYGPKIDWMVAAKLEMDDLLGTFLSKYPGDMEFIRYTDVLSDIFKYQGPSTKNAHEDLGETSNAQKGKGEQPGATEY
ncbi:hypothetical protein OSB04_014039 [Centaurea solstitialis]|uniref:Protein kinase domain-containing protein n=1 Tax=Centaurea solstitialis TaxID=347529 RepID=A0AA38TED4_9ASTR|nr:hypothetical protein OSB04_014039 [Centaurea solstitialis]